MGNGSLSSLVIVECNKAKSTAATSLTVVDDYLPSLKLIIQTLDARIPEILTASVGLYCAKWLRRSSLVVAHARLLNKNISYLWSKYIINK